MDNQIYSDGKPLDPKYNKFFYIAFIGFCLVFAITILSVTIPNHQKYNYLLEGGKSAQGEVTSVRRKNLEDSYKVKGYFTVDENEYKFSCISDKRINKGSFCTILYEEDNPSNYIVEGIETNFAKGYVAVLIALGMGAVMVFLWSLEWGKKRNVDELELYNRNAMAEKRREYIERTGDVWHIDITNEEKNEKLYQSSQPTSNYNVNTGLKRGNIGSTAFYGRENNASNS